MPASTLVKSWMRSQTWPDLRQEMIESANSAYVHPYGFIVVRLGLDEFPDWGLRLHIWPSATEFESHCTRNGAGQQLIHSHGWQIFSQTLIGAVDHRVFSVTEEPVEGQYCAYRVESDYGVGSSRLQHVACSINPSLLLKSVMSPSSGLTDIPKGQFHTTTPVAGYPIALTLAATEHVTSNLSRVLSTKHDAQGSANTRGVVHGLDRTIIELDDRYRAENEGQDEWTAFVFFTRERQVLLVRTFRNPHLWQPVGGQAQPVDRDPLATAIREVKEETGINLEGSKLESLGSLPRDKGTGLIHAWTSPIRGEPVFQENELAESGWFDVAESLKLQTFGATKEYLRKMATRMR